MQIRCMCILCTNTFLYPQVRHSFTSFTSMPPKMPFHLLGMFLCHLTRFTKQPLSSLAASDNALLSSCANFGIHWPAVEEPAQHPV